MKNFTLNDYVLNENAKTRFFESKEHYLNFKQAWKDFHNSGKLVWHEDVEVRLWNESYPGETMAMKNVKHTALSAEHYMLYNLLRGYDAHRGFREDSDHGWTACEYAVYEIFRTAKRLKDVNDVQYESNRKWAREMFEKLTLPFGGTLTPQMLYKIGEHININFYNNHNWPQFEVEEWKTEEQIAAENFREDLKNPKRNTLRERLKKFALRSD